MSAAWAGAALPRLGPRKLAIMGSSMFSCGYLLAGLADPSIDPEVLAQYGATLIAVSSLCNGVGRLFWGLLSDRIGRVRVFRFLLASQMVVFGILMTESNPWIFSALVCYVLLCFGGGGHLRSDLCRLYQGSVPLSRDHLLFPHRSSHTRSRFYLFLSVERRTGSPRQADHRRYVAPVRHFGATPEAGAGFSGTTALGQGSPNTASTCFLRTIWLWIGQPQGVVPVREWMAMTRGGRLNALSGGLEFDLAFGSCQQAGYVFPVAPEKKCGDDQAHRQQPGVRQ